MAVYSFVGCLINRHEPQRREVTWDGHAYVGNCRHCGVPIQRYGRRNWRKRKAASEQPGAPTST
jgi:hypothetical protein